MRQKVGKSRFTVFFPMMCGSGRSTSRLAKAAGAEPAGQVRDEKLHAVMARSTFPSQIVQNTPGADHFWKLRCQKSAHPCGAKRISRWKWKKKTHHDWATFERCDVEKVHAIVTQHILKSKCTKHTMVGPLLEVEMSKKCTPLWREEHFQVKMHKTPHVRATFGSSDVEKVHAVVARSTFRSQNVQNTRGSDHFWRFRCRFASLHYTTLPYTTLHYTTLHYTTLHYLPLHFTTLHYTTLRYTTTTTTTTQQHSTTLHYTKLH